jgi:preprotein translocase subunit SecG
VNSDVFLPLWAAYPPWLIATLNAAIILSGVFMILLILIQRGKGGGLAGAFGAAGGSSAFGSRAGDQFTRITLITALIWVLLIMLLTKIASVDRPSSAPRPPVSQPEVRLLLPDDGVTGPRG